MHFRSAREGLNNSMSVIPSAGRDLLSPEKQQIPRCARDDIELFRGSLALVRGGEIDVLHGHPQPGSLSGQPRGHPARGKLGIRAAIDAQIAMQAVLEQLPCQAVIAGAAIAHVVAAHRLDGRSDEHTSELQSLMRISYAVF